ncbi:hypothetical protein [Chryseobacterium daeguense]|uniref:hypothetical protein n=1 Tax=Chryseobacterium daeguense TaxID=412438 RepID=UPI00041D4011|nr:hypothetical protein [Chryseobacterium daeguense]
MKKEFASLYFTGKAKYKEGSYAYGIVESFLNGQKKTMESLKIYLTKEPKDMEAKIKYENLKNSNKR